MLNRGYRPTSESSRGEPESPNLRYVGLDVHNKTMSRWERQTDATPKKDRCGYPLFFERVDDRRCGMAVPAHYARLR